MGEELVANGSNQFIIGKHNYTDHNFAFLVGGGTSGSKKNIHSLGWGGEAWYQGDVYVGSRSGRFKDNGSKKLATEEFVTSKNYIASTVITAFWTGTQAEYDALGSYNATTLYLITE